MITGSATSFCDSPAARRNLLIRRPTCTAFVIRREYKPDVRFTRSDLKRFRRFWYKPVVNDDVRGEVNDLRRRTIRLLMVAATLVTLLGMTPMPAMAGENCTPEVAGFRHCLP